MEMGKVLDNIVYTIDTKRTCDKLNSFYLMSTYICQYLT